MPTMLDAALSYAERKWPVFPVHTIRDGRCTCNTACKSPGKHPVTLHGVLDATTDEAQVRAWWESFPDANIAVRTGAESGLWVIDQDNKRSVKVDDGIYMPEGENSLRSIEQQTGELLPETLTQITGSGGRHLIFQYPTDGEEHRNGQPLPSVDVRGQNGYIVVAPSLHANGQRYRWVDPEAPISPAPMWFVAIKRKQESEPFVPQEHVVEGERNQYLTSYAGKLRQEGADGDYLRTMVMGHNQLVCSPPLDAVEVIKIVQSVMRYPIGTPVLEMVIDVDENGEPITRDVKTDLQPNQVAISFADFMLNPPEPKQPLIYEGILDREDGFILAGQSGVGKSWLAFDMALSVASGESWLGHFGTEQGGVVYIDEEGSRSGMYRRMKMLMRGREMDNPEIPLHLVIRKGLKLDSQEGLATISRIIWEHKPKLVIADTLIRMHTGEENSAKDMARFFDLSSKLRSAYGVTIGFIHHIRKPGKDDPGELIDMIRGSSDIRGWPDSVLIAQKTDTGMKLSHAKSREHREHPALDVTLSIDEPGDYAKFAVEGQAAKATQGVEATREAIIAMIHKLQSSSGMKGPTVEAIAGTLNMSTRTIQDHLKVLEEQGIAHRFGEGHRGSPHTWMVGNHQKSSFMESTFGEYS